MNRLFTFAVGSLMLLLSNITNADDHSIDLTFGIYSNDRPSTLIRQFTPVLTALEKKIKQQTGRTVNIDLKLTRTYGDAIELLADGTFDIVRFGPVSYINAKIIEPNIKILALENVGGNKVFYGVIAVREDSDITTIAELKGTDFGFSASNSTIGRYLAQQFLVENGIKANDFTSYKYFDRHDLVGRAVANGLVDAGAFKEGTFHALRMDGYNLRELVRFPNVTKPWIAAATVSDEVVDILREGLLAIDNPRALVKLGVNGFLEGDDSDYDTIRDSITNNKSFFLD